MYIVRIATYITGSENSILSSKDYDLQSKTAETKHVGTNLR